MTGRPGEVHRPPYRAAPAPSRAVYAASVSGVGNGPLRRSVLDTRERFTPRAVWHWEWSAATFCSGYTRAVHAASVSGIGNGPLRRSGLDTRERFTPRACLALGAGPQRKRVVGAAGLEPETWCVGSTSCHQ